MAELTEGKHAGEFFVSGANGNRSMENITLITGQDLVAGAILGEITKGAATAVAGVGDTGDGVMGAITLGALAQVGEYDLACVAAPSGAISTPTTGTKTGTGNGTCTAVTAGASAIAGTYTLTCVAAATDSGTFKVVAPDGDSLPDATVAVAYTNPQLNFTINDGTTDFIVGDYFTILASAADGDVGTFTVFAPDGSRLADMTVAVAYAGDHLNMTLADGAADFIVGDSFTITVAAGSGKYTEVAPAAVDGSQVAAAALWDNTDATLADIVCAAIVRDAEINADEITWPTGITADQKTAAIVELALNAGIVTR